MSSNTSAELQSVAVLASWCDSRAHFEAPRADTFLAQPDKQQLCARIAEHIATQGAAITRSEQQQPLAPAQEAAGAWIFLRGDAWWSAPPRGRQRSARGVGRHARIQCVVPGPAVPPRARPL